MIQRLVFSKSGLLLCFVLLSCMCELFAKFSMLSITNANAEKKNSLGKLKNS